MKNPTLTILILLMIIFGSYMNAFGDVFHSTAAGGNWHEATTWQEGSVPGPTDDVVITGPGEVIICNTPEECHHLTVNPSGILRNKVNTYQTLLIHGNIDNNGTIHDPNFQLTLIAEGDVDNSGIMQFHELILAGNAGHNLIMAGGASINCGYLTIADTTGVVFGGSNLTFVNCDIDFNGGTLLLPPSKGIQVSLNGGYLKEANVLGSGNDLHMTNGSYLRNDTIDNIKIKGRVELYGNNNMFTGELVVEDTLTNRHNVHVEVLIDGNLTNDGYIIRSNFTFDVLLTGNLVNNGVFKNNYLTFTGSGTQDISCLNDNIFECAFFTDDDPATPLNALTGLRFSDVVVDLDGALVYANSNEIHLENDALFRDGAIDEPVIKGYFIVGNNNVIFTGEAVIEDTLTVNQNANITLTVQGNVTNNGTILRKNFDFDIEITGNLVNNGAWHNTATHLTGTALQTIYCQAGEDFSCVWLIDNDSASAIESLSNLTFNSTNIDLNHSQLTMPASAQFTLNNGLIREGTLIMNNSTMIFQNGAKMSSHCKVHDVIFEGEATVDGTGLEFYGNIINNDTLINDQYSNIVIPVEGSMTNNGVIGRRSYEFTLQVTGNITNDGIWNNHKLYFTGTSLQTITCNPGAYFACDYIIDSDPASPIEALTDLTFDDVQIDLNGAQFTMPASGNISMSDGRIREVDLKMNSGTFFMENNALISTDTKIEDVTFEGYVVVEGTGIEFIGDVINTDTLINKLHQTMTILIDGDIINNGLIDRQNYELNIDVTGNITNNGTWNNYRTTLTGTSAHQITQGLDGVFTCHSFYSDPATDTITAMSDLTFQNTSINLNGNVMVLSATKGANLDITAEILRDGTILGNHNSLTIRNDAYLFDMAIENITLYGNVVVYGSNNEFSGTTILEDTLRNRVNGNVTLTLKGDFINNGYLYDTNFDFTIETEGNIVNNGLWDNDVLRFTGSTDQLIGCENDSIFSPENVYDMDTSSSVIATSNLLFHNTIINFYHGRLEMPTGSKLVLTGDSPNDTRLIYCHILGDDIELTCDANTHLHNVEFEPDVLFFGEMHINMATTFNGKLDNQGLIRSKTNVNSTLNVEGPLFNNGTISDGNYSLVVNCRDHMVNNGIWNNEQTVLDGTTDQLIYLINHQQIESEVRFDAFPGNSPYQWYYEDVILDSPDFIGETTYILRWQVPVQQSWYGDFYCETGSGNSRTFVVRGGIIVDVKLLLEGPFNGTDMNTDLNDQALLPLDQPFNTAPWNYNGDESVASIPSADIVDWVLLEFRETSGGPETATSDSIVGRKALFIDKNGRLLDLQGTSEMKMDIGADANVYFVVWHRNHLGVMTANPVSLNSSPFLYDFTTSADQAYGGINAQKELAPGMFGIIAADGNSDGQIDNSDRNDVWVPQAGNNGYLQGDFNLDSEVNNLDKNSYWYPNGGAGNQVPASFVGKSGGPDYISGGYQSQVPK